LKPISQENQLKLKLNGTHQLLVYADDVNSLQDDTSTIKKNTAALSESNFMQNGGDIDPHILDLGTGWRSVVNFTARPLYSLGNRLLYPLDRRLGGTQSRSGRYGE
jgi:hypothetical protein